MNKKAFLSLLFATLLAVSIACSSTSETSTESTESEKPLVVFVAGDHEYGGEQTMPFIASELEEKYGIRAKVIKSSPDQNAEENIPGLEILEEADLAVFFLRWRRLPTDQLDMIDSYLKSGKPVMGFRTTSHAFNFPEGHESERWNAFGEFALNTPPGWGGPHKHTHYGHESTTDVSVIADAMSHPILTGVDSAFHASSWLYTTLPDYPSDGSEWLLMGSSVNPNKEAIDHPVAWTGTNSFGSKIFFTTLGHPEDFQVESFQKMVVNAVHWELDMDIPEWQGKININVPYRGIVD